ncbi:inosine/xanthosine triphosphatase [Phototrophicus methaneseepsis]|uniref:Probable inosine/xanthosine triphosphatase n=1 Tax=Phototrophicus methaneseepsis TaxID=2710758 RepID=A0A7S8EEB6_9CHLR|nr:inosine/xanthosine triphosphatase [Phototrophicus methaneseepsis]
MNASTTKIIVASTNPVKIDCTRQGFAEMFPQSKLTISGVSVPSGVADQPMSRAETIQGATNRARHAAQAHPGADYYVGIEGGVEAVDDLLEVFAWVVVLHGEMIGKAQTGIFYLPQEVADLVRQGVELGEADDRVFGRENSKQGNGAVGLLTDDAITRTSYYVPAVILALIPFKKPDLTWG